MKRVLHVMASLERSGMEQMLLSSATAWRAAGYQCDVVTTGANAGPIAEAMRAHGYGVYHMPFRSKYRFMPRPGFVRDFYRLCASGYDVVHIQVEGGRPLYAVLARLAGVPRLAVTPHNTFRFEGMLRLRKMAERHLIRLLGGRFGMISEGVRACEWERFRIRGKRIWNWIDTEHFRPPTADERAAARRALGIEEGRFVVASVANCNKAKNHPELLKALALLPEQERPLYLHVGREETGEPERALAEQFGVADEVRFFGSQPDPRLYFWAADALVMPSLYEGLGLSAVEAVACGLTLICSRIDGLLDLAKEMGGCVLTTPDANSIARGLSIAIKANATDRCAQALRDSTRIRERFSMERGVNSIVQELYA